jgi:hypothetical protein
MLLSGIYSPAFFGILSPALTSFLSHCVTALFLLSALTPYFRFVFCAVSTAHYTG